MTAFEKYLLGIGYKSKIFDFKTKKYIDKPIHHTVNSIDSLEVYYFNPNNDSYIIW